MSLTFIIHIFFFNNLRWLIICCPALREFLNPSQCLSCLLDETWMDVSYPQFVDPSANYKKLNCRHFPLFWEEFLPGAADEWWRMRCSQDPGNKRTPDPHPALLNIAHHTAQCVHKCTPHTAFTIGKHTLFYAGPLYNLYCVLHTAHWTSPNGPTHYMLLTAM